jgi:hypothetical protein
MAGASLTEVAYVTRKTIRLSAIGAVVLFVLWLVARTTIDIWIKLHPAPPPLPTVGFGQLPPLSFPTPPEQPSLTFVLETPTGGFEKMPDQAKVYFMPKSGSNFLDLDYARRQARSLGFQGEPTKMSESDYQWKMDGGFTFNTNILTRFFSYNYDYYLSDQSLLKPQRMAGAEEVGQLARGFILRAVNLPDDLATGKAKLVNFRLSGTELVPALSLSDTEFIQVGLLRRDYDELPVLAADPKKGQVWLLYTGADDSMKQFVKVEYQYQSVDPQRSETYPVRAIGSAWEELKKGKYYLAQLDEQHGSTITVRRAYLAYYDPPKYIGYLMPMYVFEGDNNFMGYAPAIDPAWVASQ